MREKDIYGQIDERTSAREQQICTNWTLQMHGDVGRCNRRPTDVIVKMLMVMWLASNDKQFVHTVQL